MALAIVALHGLAGWALLQVEPVRAALAQAAPIMVDLLAPPAPEPVRETPPAPPPPPRPVLQRPPPPAPLIVAAPAPAPAAFVAPAPPPPKEIPPAAIQYLEPPVPSYPRLSRRLRESGLVVVRVLVDVDGLPRALQLAQSSGFARLDEAALEGVRRARFKPYAENGVPTAGWARIPIPFELEN